MLRIMLLLAFGDLAEVTAVAAPYWRVVCASGSCITQGWDDSTKCGGWDGARQWLVRTLVFSDQQDCSTSIPPVAVQSSGSENGAPTNDARAGVQNAYDIATPKVGNAPPCYCGYSTHFWSDNLAATKNKAWLGAQFNESVDVKCIRLAQGNTYACGECPGLRLERSTDGSSWTEVQTWSNNADDTIMVVGQSEVYLGVWARGCSTAGCKYAPVNSANKFKEVRTCNLPETDDTPAPAAGSWAPMSVSSSSWAVARGPSCVASMVTALSTLVAACK